MGINTQAGLAISGEELRARIGRLGMTYTLAAERLGLTLAGLNKQMRGDRAVSRQTAIILDFLEREQGPKPARTRTPRRGRSLAKYLY
jgi:hypothetical protein